MPVEDARRDLLIVFTRLPHPGRAKTRLIPALGPQGAADLQVRLTEHCLAQVEDPRWEIWIAYHGGDRHAMGRWLGPDRTYVRQAAGNLGAKLQAGIALGSAAGFQSIAVIGTDCPDLDRGHVADAFAGLQQSDLILGPACDGGYYLLAQRQVDPFLFVDMPWGTSGVAAETLRRASDVGLSAECLPELADIDDPQDLPVCRRHAGLLPNQCDSGIAC